MPPAGNLEKHGNLGNANVTQTGSWTDYKGPLGAMKGSIRDYQPLSGSASVY